MTKPPKCCKEEAVYNEVLGKGFYYCRVCKKEVDAPPPEPDRKYPGMWMHTQNYSTNAQNPAVPRTGTSAIPTTAFPEHEFDPNDTQAPAFWDKAENEGWQQLDLFEWKTEPKVVKYGFTFELSEEENLQRVVDMYGELRHEDGCWDFLQGQYNCEHCDSDGGYQDE